MICGLPGSARKGGFYPTMQRGRHDASRFLHRSITNRVKLDDELPLPRNAVASKFYHIVCRVVSQNIWIASGAIEVGQQLFADIPSADVDASHGVEYAVQAVLALSETLYSPTIKRTRALVWKRHRQPPVRMTCSHYAKAIIDASTRPNSLVTFIVQPVIGRAIPMPSVRAKAGLPWPVTGTYLCDKCHGHRLGEAGAIATRCNVWLHAQQRPCNCAYFVLTETPGPVDRSSS